ncbi:OmpP1/FadL family transporter [Pseudovibrio sp. SPO723]|uniref:OmpP1/FadL family transporter n=1 Tax=Nesiotobacter zosterae TaxID=392721 RepID=UPI0029C4CED3|nr:OmpP1/FadL family transporter [Pseudovibrio sp. SPO723]MDX5594112.1 OmpP1/FadL family transporter [Pseudovibrio sp. SPO723]
MTGGNRYLAATCLTALLFTSGEALAGAFALREQSAAFQGLSFAGYGTASNTISTIFWNPATVTAHDGLKAESVNSFILPNGDVDTNSVTVNGIPLGLIPGAATGEIGDVGVNAWLPGSYGTYQYNDQIYLGFAVNAPYGLSTKPNIISAGQIYARSSEVLSVNATPMVGVKLNEMFSFAIGLQAQYFQVRLKSASGISTTSSTVELRGEDNVGFGGTAGLLITPLQGTQIGIGYRSPIRHDLDGQLKVGASSQNINADLVLPEQVNVSIQQEVTPELRLMGTFEWTNWSRFGNFNVFNQSGIVLPQAALGFQYSDGYFLSFGAEYDFDEHVDGLTVRAGLGYEWSPISEKDRSIRLPDTNRVWVSAGASYEYNENLSFDLGYSHLFAESDDINIGPGHPAYNGVVIYQGDVEASVDIISAAFRYKF